jgi:hypothetical protein
LKNRFLVLFAIGIIKISRILFEIVSFMFYLLMFIPMLLRKKVFSEYNQSFTETMESINKREELRDETINIKE